MYVVIIHHIIQVMFFFVFLLSSCILYMLAESIVVIRTMKPKSNCYTPRYTPTRVPCSLSLSLSSKLLLSGCITEPYYDSSGKGFFSIFNDQNWIFQFLIFFSVHQIWIIKYQQTECKKFSKFRLFLIDSIVYIHDIVLWCVFLREKKNVVAKNIEWWIK